KPLDKNKTYLIKHAHRSVRGQFAALEWRLNLDTLAQEPAEQFAVNDIGRVRLSCTQALYADAYKNNHATGAFIVVDTLTNNTVAAGMILDGGDAQQSLASVLSELSAGSAIEPMSQVSPKEREERMGQKGMTVWLVGL